MPANHLRKSLTATIAVPAILLAVAAIGLLWELSQQKYDTGWVEHTDRVMLLTQTAKAEFLMAQNALRGFLISSSTLLIGDHLLVDRITLAPPAKWIEPLVYYREPRRNDVVVFIKPVFQPESIRWMPTASRSTSTWSSG